MNTRRVEVMPALKAARGRYRLAQLGSLAKRKPLGVIGLVILVSASLMAVFGPYLAPYNPIQIDASSRLLAPGRDHLMGTDNFGRDVFSRVLVGARESLLVGLLASFSGITTGALLGVFSGYFGGKLDLTMQRLVDMKMAFPTLILALALIAVLGPSTRNVIIAIGVAVTPGAVRVVRSSSLSIKEQVFVDAARAVGTSDWGIVFRHVVPNCMAPYLVLLTLVLGSSIIAASSLSFLGLGTPPPAPTWGGMLSGEGRRYLERAPWIAMFPGVAISLTVFGINVFGDALRDILDPRLRS